MKDKILAVAISIFVAVLGFFAIMILTHDNRISLLEQSLGFLEKEIESCVHQDVYQVDKMLMNERFAK